MIADLKKFYNKYHKKNRKYYSVISENNFTYFYLINLLKKPEFNTCQTILDIGCGVGSLSLYLASKGKEVVGVDVSSRAIAIANNAKKLLDLDSVEFVVSSIEKFKNKKKFDAVLLIEVIEHIEDDKGLVEKIKQMLKSEGLVLLTTPSSENLMFKLGFYRQFDQQVGHLRRYSKQEIERLLESKGFEVLYLYEKESLLRSLFFTTKLGFLARFVKGPFVVLFHILDELVGKIFGFTDILVVARKNKSLGLD
ncbi:MAG: hypothetical protein KatS3mg090_0484 [Patescibacteria group bacterium]|nr:MAG: hypothetical protein KatS3mg090_0484 [Patescibacteria group bacterium]